MIPLLTYLILFVTPLIIASWLPLRFEPPKVLFAEFIIELLVIFAIVGGKISLKRADKWLIVLIGILFILSLGHLILNPSKQSLFGNIFRLQGTILFWHLLVLCFVAQNIFFRLKDKYIYLSAFIAICVGALLFGSNRAGRWIGSLGEPNALGAVIVFIFPLVFLSFKNIWIRAIGVIGAIGVINFTESKSALIALGLELLLLALIKLFKERYLLSVIICSLMLVLALGLPILERIYFLKTNTDPMNFRFEDRAQIWQVALISGLDSPIYGSGLESIQDQIHKNAERLNFNAQYQAIDSSHNIFLDFWVWGGILGVGVIGVIGVIGIKNMVQKKMLLELTVFLGLITVLSFNPTTVSVLAGFWWIIGRSFGKGTHQNLT